MTHNSSNVMGCKSAVSQRDDSLHLAFNLKTFHRANQMVAEQNEHKQRQANNCSICFHGSEQLNPQSCWEPKAYSQQLLVNESYGPVGRCARQSHIWSPVADVPGLPAPLPYFRVPVVRTQEAQEVPFAFRSWSVSW